MKQFAILRLLGAVSSLALLLGACTANSPDGTRGNSPVTLRVGDTGWARYEAALRVAGLDKTPYGVEWSVFSGGDQQMQALRSKALDIATSSEIPPISVAAASSEPNFKVAAVQRGSTLNQEVIAAGNSPVTSIAQLKGKRVGYVKNTTAQYFLNELLVQNGLKWTDIVPAPLQPNDGVAALNSGAVDAFAGYGNAIITSHHNGARTIGSGKDILSGNFLWSATDDSLADQRQRAALADLLARIHKAYAYIRNGHQKEFAEATAAGTHQPVQEALEQLQEQEQQRPTEIVTTSQDAIASQQRVADSFSSIRAIPRRVGVASFWTNALDADLKRALEKP